MTSKVRRRRALSIFVVLMAGVVGAIGACSFPEVTAFTQEGAEAGSEGGIPEGSTSDVSDDVFVLIDGGDPDALIVKDAGKPVDPASCQVEDCDCDSDGFSRAKCDAGADSGRLDCDDLDPRTKPDQGYLPDEGMPPRNGDWNCANGVERFYKGNVSCAALGPGAACNGTFGFENEPKCGLEGPFTTCKTDPGILGVIAASCIVASRAPFGTKQACK